MTDVISQSPKTRSPVLDVQVDGAGEEVLAHRLETHAVVLLVLGHLAERHVVLLGERLVLREGGGQRAGPGLGDGRPASVNKSWGSYILCTSIFVSRFSCNML